MALNSGTANALGAAIASAVTGLSQSDKENPTKIWQEVAKAIYNALKTDASVTIVAGTIVTAGGPASQTGPAAPLILPLA